ncbi:Glutathione S-transferase 1, isoform C [Halotydeus destructor]|nr:Glutathione S-transferase 1, isoform C [Halotydeus destructor]
MAAGELKTPEYLTARGTVPALEDGGWGIGESRAIITDLANKYAPASDLYPSDPARRLRWSCGSILTMPSWTPVNAITTALYSNRKPPESKPEREGNFKKALTELDTQLSGSQFVAGNEFPVADISINPRGPVPALKDGDWSIGESRAIITNLANKYAPTSDLYPSDPARRAQVDMWLHFDNAVLDAGQRLYYSTFFIDKKAPESKPEKESSFKAALTELDTHLSQSKFVAGNEFTLADISVLGTFFFADAFKYDLAGYANIKRWEADAKAQLPFYDEIVNEALPMLQAYLGSLKNNMTA